MTFGTTNVGGAYANVTIGVAQALGGSTEDTTTYFKFTYKPQFDNDGNDISTATLAAVSHVLDEGSDWYIATPGQALTEPNLQAGQFTPLVVGNAFYPASSVTPAGPIYLVFDTGYGKPGRGQVLGWLLVESLNGRLSLRTDAVAYNEPGIIVGSTTVVPEPASLLPAAAALALSRRWRKAG